MRRPRGPQGGRRASSAPHCADAAGTLAPGGAAASSAPFSQLPGVWGRGGSSSSRFGLLQLQPWGEDPGRARCTDPRLRPRGPEPASKKLPEGATTAGPRLRPLVAGRTRATP